MRAILYLFTCIVFIFGSSFGIRAQIMCTYAGDGYTGHTGDNGPATGATFNVPVSLAINKSGNLYVDDEGNYCVRMVKKAGMVISTIAGSGARGYNGDHIAADTAWLNDNWGVAVDKNGNLFIADQGNHCVRKVDTFGIITTIAGVPGDTGTTGDGGAATLATMVSPVGIATDSHGNIFVFDQDKYVLRKINSAGIISRVAGIPGSGGVSGDGGAATQAELGFSWGIAVDTAGNVYMCDQGNNIIRKVNKNGIISTFAGTGVAGFSGEGSAATSAALNFPIGVCADVSGNVYIADCYNNRVRKVSPSGIINTISGTGTHGFYGDGGLATAAVLAHPTSVAVDDSGNIFINDLDNVRVREIKKINLMYFTRGRRQYYSVCEDEISAPLDSVLSVLDYYSGLTDSWSILSPPEKGYLTFAFTTTSTGDTLYPSGIYYTPYTSFSGLDSFTERVTDGILSDTTTVYISVNPLVIPGGVITGPSAVCPGSGITLNETLRGGVWSSVNGNANVLNKDSFCVVTGVYAGPDTIEYTVNSTCGEGSAWKPITVNILPDVGVISGPSNICTGESILLTESVSGGIWSGNDSDAIVIPNDSAAVIRSVKPGTEIIQYTVSNAFCSASASKSITINTQPYVGAITGAPDVCQGAVITLADSVAGGEWTSTNAMATVSAGAISGTAIVSGVATGKDTIIYTVNFFCGTATARKEIYIDSLPVAPSISENKYLLYVPSGYSSYQWTLNGTIIPGADQDTFIVTEAGVYAVIVTNAAGCAVTSQSVNCPDCSPDEISIYPNPSDGIVNIQWCKKVTVRIIFMDGKVLRMGDGLNEIDIGDLPDGAYLLAIYGEHGNKVKTKLITKISQK